MGVVGKESEGKEGRERSEQKWGRQRQVASYNGAQQAPPVRENALTRQSD